MIYNRLIVLYYRPYASGNFLANILSHNRAFVPKFVFDPDILRYHQGKKLLELTDDELFQAQLKLLKTTLPNTKEQCVDWWKYELGCAAFWAKDFQTYIRFGENLEVWLDNLRQEPFALMERGKYCFIVAHDIQQYKCIVENFHGAITVQLLNEDNVIQIGKKVKSAKIPNRPSNILLDNVIQFDISSMWDKTAFFANIQKLLETLNVSDKTLDFSVDDYYNRYIELHS